MNFLEFINKNKNWLLAGSLMSLSSSFGQTFFISIFAGQIIYSFNLTNGEWGLYYTIGTSASAICMIYAGTFADKYKAKTLVIAMLILLSSASCFMGALSVSILLPFAVFALRFSGQGMLSHLCVVSISRWFSKQRGKALAVSTLGFAFGEAFLPLIFVALLAVLSWRSLWFLAALIPVGLIPIFLLLLKNERSPSSFSETSESLGIDNRHWARGEVLRSLNFWLYTPIMIFPGMFVTAVFFQQYHLSLKKGWAHIELVALFPVYTFTSVGSMFLFGWASDRFGSRKLLCWYQIPLALSLISFSYASNLREAAFAFLLMGLAQGGHITIFNAFWPETFGTKNIGSIKALIASIGVFGSALGPGISGLLIDYGFEFSGQMYTFGLITLAGCLLAFLGTSSIQKIGKM